MNPPSLSKEEVASHRKLFLAAIAWYEARQIEENRQDESYLRDPDYSLIPSLKKTVESAEAIPNGELKLLVSILTSYRPHLEELKRKPWIRKETIESQLAQLTEMDHSGPVRDDKANK